MITQMDVQQTLRAADPTITQEQIRQTYETMMQQWDELQPQLAWELRQKWIAKEGRDPDGITWGRMVNLSQQMADDQIRGQWLEPLSQQIVQEELEDWETDEEDNYHLAALKDPNGWRTRAGDITPSRQAEDTVRELWNDETPRFRMFAANLMERRLYLGLDLPNRKEHPVYLEVISQIQDAVADGEQNQ